MWSICVNLYLVGGLYVKYSISFQWLAIIFIDDVLVNVCMQMHLNILLELHEAADVSLAFQHFSAWINEGVDELIFVKHITGKVNIWYMLRFVSSY